MKEIIRMNQLAGIITEGQARKMMNILNEADSDIETLKDFLETNSYGMEVLDEKRPTVPFQFTIEVYEGEEEGFDQYDKEAEEEFLTLKNLLKSLGITFKVVEDEEDGNKVMFVYANRMQLRKALGM